MEKTVFEISFVKSKKNVIWMVLSLIIFTILSCIFQHAHLLSFDEIHAYMIAQNCSFWEIFKVTHTEGHLCLWYLILMPFAKLNLFFPWNMICLNFLFCLFALVLMWLFAPFNNYVKLILTFQFYFLRYLSVFSRCYSIGVLILFVLCILYKSRKNHVVLYSVLLVLLANTSMMGLMGAFVLGCIFLRDLFLFNKSGNISYIDYVKSLGILVFGEFLVLAQVVFTKAPVYETSKHYLYFYNYITTGFPFWKYSISALVVFFTLLSSFFFKNDRRIALFYSSVVFLLIIVFCFAYSGRIYHYSFIFIYLVCAMWMYLTCNVIETKFQKVYYSLFIALCAILVFYPDYYKANGNYINIRNYLKKNLEIYDGKKIFLWPMNTDVNYIVPYFRDTNMEFYNPHGVSLKSCTAYKNIWNDREIEVYLIAHIVGKGNVGYIFWDKEGFLYGKKDINRHPLVKFVDSAWPILIYEVQGI